MCGGGGGGEDFTGAKGSTLTKYVYIDFDHRPLYTLLSILACAVEAYIRSHPHLLFASTIVSEVD